MQTVTVLLVLLLTLPALVPMRRVMGRRITQLMLRKSQQAGSVGPSDTESEEQPAGTALAIRELDSESLPPEAEAARVAAVRGANAWYVKMWFAEAIACGAYVLAGYLEGTSSSTFTSVAILAVFYVWVISFRLALQLRMHSEVRGRIPFFAVLGVVGKVLLGPFRVLLGARTGWVPTAIVIVAAAFIAANSESLPAQLAFGAAILLQVVLRILLYWRSQHGENRKLLMLRVFGMDESAFLTFGYLLDYWRKLGSSFTIVDPSYFNFQHRALSPGNVGVVLWCAGIGSFGHGLVSATGDGNGIAHETGQFAILADGQLALVLLVSFLIVIGYLVYLAILYATIPRSFAASGTQIRQRLARLLARPRRFDLGFRDLHLYCFDNTWRLAVSEFVDTADIVLMDLRGYSAERKGCDYEVDFLFDSLAVERIVFLVDEKNDRDAVRRLLAERWVSLKTGSPNVGAAEPVATVYVSGNQRTNDVKGLINLLLARAGPYSTASASDLSMATT